MNKETPKELIERIGYNEFYRYYMEKQYYIKELQQRIDKAIEYIKTHLDSNFKTEFDYITTNPQELLEILGDKE